MLSPKNQPPESHSRPKHTHIPHTRTDIYTYIHNFICTILLQNPQCAHPTDLTIDLICFSLKIYHPKAEVFLKVVIPTVLNSFKTALMKF